MNFILNKLQLSVASVVKLFQKLSLTSSLALLLSCFFVSFVVQAEAQPAKPNILFIIADDLNNALSGFGHPQCRTPQLDKLAKNSVKFESMHCQYPLCGPSRASIMSGQYPYTNGTLKNLPYSDLRKHNPDITTLPELFKKNGYISHRISKIYHMGIPSEIINGTADSDDEQSWSSTVNIKAPEQNSPGDNKFLSPGMKGSQTFHAVKSKGGDHAQADGMAVDKAIEFLRENKDNPFFLALGFVRPHVPLVAPIKYFDLYKNMDMQLPDAPSDDLNDVPEIIRGYKTTNAYKPIEGGHAKILQAYYATVSYMDAQAGRVIAELENLGIRENTIVVFTSDHGYLLGEHHKWQKQHLFKGSTRVPFIVSVPWINDTHGQSTLQITELIDLYPTLSELAQLTPPDDIQGNSLLQLLQNPETTNWKKSTAFTISRSGGESLRTQKWRYTQWGYGDSGQELYDLSKDPDEFTNLADNPEYKTILANLKQQLTNRRLNAGYNEAAIGRFLKKRGRRNNK